MLECLRYTEFDAEKNMKIMICGIMSFAKEMVELQHQIFLAF